MKDLFEGFESVSLDRWKQQIEKDLKGVKADELKYTDDSGLVLEAVYNAENSPHQTTPVFSTAEWKITSDLTALNELELNKVALHDLQYGAESLVFSLKNDTNSATILNGVFVENIELNIECAGSAVAIADGFARSFAGKKLNGFFNADVVAAVVNEKAVKPGWDEWISLFEHKLFQADFSPWVSDVRHYHANGANAVTELALTLSHLNEQLNALHEKGLKKETRLRIVTYSSSNFFESVAKLRALRSLVVFLLKQYGQNNRVNILCYTSPVTETQKDVYNNLIRTSIQSMAAVCGGADAVSVSPFNALTTTADLNARRWALDQQLILREEASLGAVADVGAGSYFLEEYTTRLSAKSWNLFREFEQKGGLIKMAESGELKKVLQQQAEQLLERYSKNDKTLIGVNKFPNAKESSVVVRPSKSGISAEQYILKNTKQQANA